MYKDKGTPLLFGGVASSCSGSFCKSRETYWGRTCSFNSEQTWGVCNQEQRRHSLEYARTLGNGDILRLTPCHVLKFLRGRTLWLIGDSHSKTLYRALQCFLFDFWDQRECEASAAAADVQALYNLPAAPGQSKCFHLLGKGGGRVCMVHAVLGSSLVGNSQVAEGGVLPLLQSRFARRTDIFYINFGVWHKKSDTWRASFKPALEALGRFYKATKSRFPHVLYRETPAEHPKDSSSNACQSMRGYTYQPWDGRLVVNPAARIAVQGWDSGGWMNTAARTVLGKYKIPVVAAFNISVPLANNHIGSHMSPELDCLHYCVPGVPEMWVWYLFNAIASGRSGIKAIASSSSREDMAAATRSPNLKYKCVPTATMF
uniref:Trichome birefringence-like N-terminal domain-containing protein n=1 Tax=Tetradesmus obliquus TaxID=3088 RepID=A0A383VCQ2_TETOB|eukprot:jgi/Sobl393_1/13571/SZX63345.1